MKQYWEKVKLNKVLKQYRITVWIDDTKQYNQLTNSKHSGIKARGYKAGSEIGRKRQFIVDLNKYPHTILYTRQTIQQDEAIGLCPHEVNGCVVTENMPLFAVENADPNFIEFYFKTDIFLKQLHSTAAIGTSQQSILEDTFLNFEIPLPPLSEQQRIAGRLAALKGKIDAVRALRGEQVREVERVTFDVLDNFFVAGEEKTIGQVCEKPQYGYTASADFQNGNVRFVRITDIQNGQVQWQSVPYCQCENPTNYLLKEDDILFARTGGTIGKSFLVKSVPEAAVFASYLIRLRVKEKVLPEYLYLFFQSKSYWQQITNSKSGTGQPNLNGSKLAEIVLKVPAIPEQRRIVSEIKAFQTKMEALKSAQAEQLSALEGLFPGLLEQAFRGEW